MIPTTLRAAPKAIIIEHAKSLGNPFSQSEEQNLVPASHLNFMRTVQQRILYEGRSLGD